MRTEPATDAGASGDARLVRVAVSTTHACALTVDGRVVCWGGARNRPPTALSFSARASQVALLLDTTTVASSNGQLVGSNFALPADGLEGSTIPLDARGGLTVSVAGRVIRVCAQSLEGRVSCVTPGAPQERVASLDGVKRLSAAGSVVAGIDPAGRLLASGLDRLCADAQPGSTPIEPAVPFDVLGETLRDVGLSRCNACVVTTGGRAMCWGDNTFGQLGDGTFDRRDGPDRRRFVAGINDAVEVSVGDQHVCVLRSDATVACWGNNSRGQLGSGTQTTSPTAVPVALLEGAANVAVGSETTCAVLRDGTARCWGSNLSRILGSGTVDDATRPVRVRWPN